MIPSLVQQVEAAGRTDEALRDAVVAARYAAGLAATRRANLDRGVLAAVAAGRGLSAAQLVEAAPEVGLSDRGWRGVLLRMVGAGWVEMLPPPRGLQVGPGVPIRYAITEIGRSTLARLEASPQPVSKKEH